MRKSESSGSGRRKRATSRREGSSGKAKSPRRSSGSSSGYKPTNRGDNREEGRFGKRSSDTKKSFEHKDDRRPGKKKFTKPGESRTGSGPDREQSKERGFFKKQQFGSNKPKRYSDKKQEKPTIANTTGKIRLNRYIANSGVCSRREADELIKMGLVSVNGKVITEMGFQVNPGDEVRYEDKVLRAEKPVYILLNKPKGYLTTTKDPQERNTVMHIIGSSIKERVYPVGRLDRNTTGLLLLTNDGDLAEKLSHPSYNVKKIYKVELNRPLTKNDFQKILDGVQLEEGRAMVDDLAIVSEDGKTVGIELHIGWNRVVRRIFERLEYEIVKLDRSVYAGLDKKDLPRGHWRFLTQEEIIRLKHYGK
jgi:23S rRNA pseudouridine2605 synthase